MSLETNPEPDQSGSILFVGQDAAGHWLVQEKGGRLEGRFISLAAALAFARAECHGFPGASIAVVAEPLVPTVPFIPVAADETAFPRAA